MTRSSLVSSRRKRSNVGFNYFFVFEFTELPTPSSVTSQSVDNTKQSDQMGRLFVQYLAILNNEN